MSSPGGSSDDQLSWGFRVRIFRTKNWRLYRNHTVYMPPLLFLCRSVGFDISPVGRSGGNTVNGLTLLKLMTILTTIVYISIAVMRNIREEGLIQRHGDADMARSLLWLGGDGVENGASKRMARG